ncbi:hypothetical protein BXY82_1375, partial [Gelidibacter sediminis]
NSFADAPAAAKSEGRERGGLPQRADRTPKKEDVPLK